MSGQHYLTTREKYMIARVHGYFQRVDGGDRDAKKGGLRVRVAKCVGIGERTLDRVMKEYNDNDKRFPEVPLAPARGRPEISYDATMVEAVRQIVNEKNLNLEPTSTKDIIVNLRDTHSENIISERTLHRLLHREGFYFGEGKKQNSAAVSDMVLGFRASYLAEKLKNRDERGWPILPEVYLDESYCNKNHTRTGTWIDSATGIQFTPSRKGERAVMVAAGVLRVVTDEAETTERKRHKAETLHGEFVPGSLEIWEANAAPTPDSDYHGNFDSDTFEPWFDDMCYSAMMEYGPVVIHMDGAKYHMRNLNLSPTTQWSKAELQDFLMDHDIYFHEKALKPELYLLTKTVHVSKDYACMRIAAKYGHRVLITPPYHPELQPIEIIWAVVKNAVAATRQRTMKELMALLPVLFAKKVTSDTWCGAYRKAQSFEDEYWKDLSEDREANASAESDSDEEVEIYAF